jgi:hypothetical protein
MLHGHLTGGRSICRLLAADIGNVTKRSLPRRQVFVWPWLRSLIQVVLGEPPEDENEERRPCTEEAGSGWLLPGQDHEAEVIIRAPGLHFSKRKF